MLDFHKIYDTKQNLIAVLNINKMIPIPKCLLKEIDTNIKNSDDKETIKYKQLLNMELKFLNNNSNKQNIEKKSINLYNIVTNEKDNLNENEVNIINRSCDFKKLEEDMALYCNINNIPLEKEKENDM